MTIYEGEVLSPRDDLEIGAMIMTAFQDMKVEKVKMITDMMHDGGFTKQRAIDAVKRVIKDHIAWGHEPHVGNFIGFDQRVQLYTVTEVTKLSQDGVLSWDDVAIARIEGRSGCRSAGERPVLLVKRTDADRYGIETREPKQHGQEWPD